MLAETQAKTNQVIGGSKGSKYANSSASDQSSNFVSVLN